MESFLDYLIKLNHINQTSSLYGHPIPIEYEEIANAYSIRNEIAHGINTIDISKTKVISFWDNLVNMMDISQTIFESACNEELRSSLDDDYELGREKQKRTAISKICTYHIMVALREFGIIKLGKDNSIKTLTGLNSYERKMISENANWVIPMMLKNRGITKNQNYIQLTRIGRERLARTSKKERQKWKRNASDIICTWLKKNES